jgi:hypothetical protein
MVDLKKSEAQNQIRDTLFGDMSLDLWSIPQGDPWSSFGKVKASLDSGDKEKAIEILQKVAQRKGIESRHTIQAWHFLRQLGVYPPEGKAKILYGVVVEAALEEGLDIVAAYADYTARYYNFSGAAVIWEYPDDSLNLEINNLLDAAQSAVLKIGPWDQERPPAPPIGQVRLNMLTPSGLHFGQAPFEVMLHDELGEPVIKAAIELMKALIARAQEERGKKILS